MSKPKPRKAFLCDHCNESWTQHLLAVQRRHQAKGKPRRTLGDYARYVKTIDCIEVLKRRNQGPAGPQGPMGAPGVSGPPGPPGFGGVIQPSIPSTYPVISSSDSVSIGRPDPYREP